VRATLNGETVAFNPGQVTGVLVQGRVGDDTLTLDSSNGFPVLTGGITFDGGSGNNTLVMPGASTFTAETEAPTGPASGTIVFDANPAITYSNVQTIDDTISISGQATYKAASAGGPISVANGGKVNGSQATQLSSGTLATVYFANKPNVVVAGQGGDDTFKILSMPAAGAHLHLDGGAGSNWLDYSAYSAAVTVNLATGTATATAGISNIQDVIGGNFGNTLTGNSQGNILIGGSAADTLAGGSGRSILVGGAGKNTITGGTGDDIVIGGSVSFGAPVQAALVAILTEWQRTDETYDQRVAKIRAGAGPGNAYQLVWGSTVLDDGARNTLRGDPPGGPTGLDWFFANLATGHDTIADKLNSEHLNNK
jgi:Ca2+-binding RTX toxin-like protein